MPKVGSVHKMYKKLKVILTDGSEFETRSTFNSSNGTMRLDIDPSTHPAWNPNASLSNTKLGQTEGFNTRYKGISFLGIKN